MDAWQVSEKDFPRGGSVAEKAAFCVHYAVLAPSVYNTQPWHFTVNGNTVSVYADRRFGLPVIDPDDRQLNLSCAAALYNLRLALRYFGLSETTELVPEPAESSLLARVKVSESDQPVDEPTKTLFKAIAKRHTNRGAFADKPVPEDVTRNLVSAAASEGAWLHICSLPERQVIVRMISEADHIQAGNKNFRRELASWVDQRRALSGDGMPGTGLSYDEVVNSLAPSPVRRFVVENNATATDQQLDENSPVLAILGSKSGGSVEHLSAGQALMRVLLQAEIEGLSVSTLNQPCEVPELRLVMHDEIGHPGRAQMILRIGYGGKPSYTPRRPLESVLETGKAVKSPAASKAANDPNGGGLFRRMTGVFRK